MSEVATPADGTTAGSLLRDAREAAGMHVASLAALLKVPVPKLEALEQDRHDLLPDAVFVRALASSVCRTLKIDPQPVLQRLPQTAQPRLVQDSEGINAPFRAPGDGPKPGWMDQFSRPVLLTVVALLLAAAVVVFLPALQRGYETVAAAAGPDPVMPPPGAAATVPTAPVAMESTGSAPLAMSSVMAPSAAAPAATPAPAPAPAAAAAPAPAAAPATAAPAAAASPQAAASEPSGIIVFRARAPSWIQVTDARGATVLRRLMVSGETAGATGTLPLSVTVGSAESTDVQVRGQPFNLAAVSRDNVARFEVK
jgi:cytoskeleton protein RodZ